MTGNDEEHTPEPVRRGRVPRLLVAGSLLLLGAGLLLRLAGGERGTTERVLLCESLQPETDDQQENVVACLAQTLVAAAEGGTYHEILALTEHLRKGRLQSSCHAAGHRAGIELQREYGIDAALARLFPPGEDGAPVDYICTSAVVHGLVGGGETDGSDPADVAASCMSLDRVDYRYTHECAHFYGHGVWRRTGELGPGLVRECSLLAGGTTGLAPEICVTGAVMQKYDLQTKHYDPFNEEAKARKTPTREELESLCDNVTGNEAFSDGCNGAVGWLAAMRAQDRLDEHDERSPGYRDLAIEVYTDELGICRDGATLQEQCSQNFITHFRPQAYHDGIAREVCERAAVDMERCEKVIALRTGTGEPADGPVVLPTDATGARPGS